MTRDTRFDISDHLQQLWPDVIPLTDVTTGDILSPHIAILTACGHCDHTLTSLIFDNLDYIFISVTISLRHDNIWQVSAITNHWTKFWLKYFSIFYLVTLQLDKKGIVVLNFSFICPYLCHIIWLYISWRAGQKTRGQRPCSASRQALDRGWGGCRGCGDRWQSHGSV